MERAVPGAPAVLGGPPVGPAGQSKETKVKLDDPLQPGDTIVVKAKRF